MVHEYRRTANTSGGPPTSFDPTTPFDPTTSFDSPAPFDTHSSRHFVGPQSSHVFRNYLIPQSQHYLGGQVNAGRAQDTLDQTISDYLVPNVPFGNHHQPPGNFFTGPENRPVEHDPRRTVQDHQTVPQLNFDGDPIEHDPRRTVQNLHLDFDTPIEPNPPRGTGEIPRPDHHREQAQVTPPEITRGLGQGHPGSPLLNVDSTPQPKPRHHPKGTRMTSHPPKPVENRQARQTPPLIEMERTPEPDYSPMPSNASMSTAPARPKSTRINIDDPGTNRNAPRKVKLADTRLNDGHDTDEGESEEEQGVEERDEDIQGEGNEGAGEEWNKGLDKGQDDDAVDLVGPHNIEKPSRFRKKVAEKNMYYPNKISAKNLYGKSQAVFIAQADEKIKENPDLIKERVSIVNKERAIGWDSLSDDAKQHWIDEAEKRNNQPPDFGSVELAHFLTGVLPLTPF